MQVTLRRLHQQRAAAVATLSVLRHLLPPPALADLSRGSQPWAARAHAEVSVLSAVLIDPHGLATSLAKAHLQAAAGGGGGAGGGSSAVTGGAGPHGHRRNLSGGAVGEQGGLAPAALVGAMHEAVAAFDGLCDMHGVIKIGTTGDEFVCAGGLDAAADGGLASGASGGGGGGGGGDHLQRLLRVAAGMVTAVGALQQQVGW